VLAFGDAWMPNNTGEDLIARARELRSRAERPIDLVVMGARNDAAALEGLREAGCRRVVRWIPSTHKSGIEAALEKWESTVAELNGEA
jgi:hypothetical protein